MALLIKLHTETGLDMKLPLRFLGLPRCRRLLSDPVFFQCSAPPSCI